MKKKMPKVGKELETQKISTVNVIEYITNSVHTITSFKENKVGNREAEMLFHKLVKENYPETMEEEIEDCLDNGYFMQGGYEVYITHS
jgi:hypothetical protein